MYDRRVSSEVYHVLRPMPTVEFTLILDYQGHNTEGPLQGSRRRLWTQAVWKSFFPSRINVLRTQSYISLARSLVNITTSWNRQLAYYLYLNFMSHQHYISFGKPHKSPSSTDKNGRDDLEIPAVWYIFNITGSPTPGEIQPVSADNRMQLRRMKIRTDSGA